jgi:hypothetical protein
LPEDEVKAMLSTDTWLSADESLEKGFATEIVDEIEVKASFDVARAEMPEKVKAMFAPKASVETEPPVKAEEKPEPEVVDEPAEPTITEQIEAVAKASGMEAYAATWALAGIDLAGVKSRVSEAREIKALAVVAKKPDLADAAIRSGTKPEAFRAALIEALAKEDESTHTDNTRQNAQQAGSTEKPPVSSQSLWASHNKHAK